MDGPGLSDAQVKKYRKEDYLVVLLFFGPDILDWVDLAIREMAEEALAAKISARLWNWSRNRLKAKHWCGGSTIQMKAMRRSARWLPQSCLVDCIQSLIGFNLNLQHSKRNMKPRRTFIFEYRAAAAFPIQITSSSAGVDANRPIFGNPDRFARGAGSPPYIPRFDSDFVSLYDLQTRSKKRMADSLK